jgi:hypothetical protein
MILDKITHKKTNALLEKLADDVMTQVATNAEMSQKADKADTNKVVKVLGAQDKNIDILRAEQIAQSKTLDRIELEKL